MIIDVDFNPTRGAEKKKVRPAVVVSHDSVNNISPVIVVVPLTSFSEKKERIEWMIRIDPDSSNGLENASLADCIQIKAIDIQQRFKKIRGFLIAGVMAQIDQSLRNVLFL